MSRYIIYLIPNLINSLSFTIFPTKKGKRSKIYGLLYRRGKGIVTIGHDTIISSSKIANPLAGARHTTLIANNNAAISIGDYCGISNSTIIANNGIVIGNNVLIGADVKIYDSDFHSISAEFRNKKHLDKPVTKPIKICDNVFIGAHTIILKGVTIGQNSVVGAGSVVTRNIPEDEIWAGNPARKIRSL